MIERLLGGLTLAVCLVLLLRLILGRRRRQRFDAAARQAWAGGRQALRRTLQWRTSRREAASAAEVAEAAIRRARSASTREGNVIRPKSFRGPRKPH